MSDARVAALVCEGHTDVPILRAFVQELWPEIDDVRCLQPELDEIERAKGPTGWSEVRSWCEQHAGRLADVLDPDVGDPIDLLLVAIDVDIAIEAGIADPPRRVGSYETTRLRTTVTQWLRTSAEKRLPRVVVISTPVMAIEAWIVAALFPRSRAPERIRNPAGWLVHKKKLRTSPSDAKPWKELHRYRDFAPRVAGKLDRVRRACSEAERTASEIEQRRAEKERTR